MGRDGSVGIATRYGLEGPGIESRWGVEIFRARPDRPWSAPGLLYNGYRVSLKRPGRGVDHPPPSSAELNERVELYLGSPSGPSWPFIDWTLHFHKHYDDVYYLFGWLSLLLDRMFSVKWKCGVKILFRMDSSLLILYSFSISEVHIKVFSNDWYKNNFLII